LAQHPNFNQQLQKAALHTLDRKELFALIEKTIVETKIETSETIAAPIVEAIAVEEEMKESLATEKTTEPEMVFDFNISSFKNEEPIFEITPFYFDKISLAEIEKTEEKVDTKIVIDENNFAELPNIISEILPLPQEIKMNTNNEINNTSFPQNSTEKTFSAWLKHYSKGSNIKHLQENEKNKKENLPKTKSVKNVNDEMYEDEEEVDDLKVNLAELSKFGFQQHDEFVTETMAKIFIQQEKYDKAISTYEKLSLLKPEKSAFFASQILELKNKIQ